MAKENVKKFLEELSTNKELQEKFMAAQKGYEAEGKGEEEIFEDIVLPIAKEAGFEFTDSEYRAIQRDVMAEKGISEEELENVSGGGLCLCIGFGKYLGGCVLIGGCEEILDYNDNADDEGTLTAGVGFTECSSIGFGFGGYF